jgi:hypothetical protein
MMRLSGGELELSACRNPERPAESLVRPCYVMEEDPARCDAAGQWPSISVYDDGAMPPGARVEVHCAPRVSRLPGNTGAAGGGLVVPLP